jgi:septum site-determining protein MinC
MVAKEKNDLINIKGIREGLLIALSPDGGEWADMTTQLMARIDEKKGFFKGARAALDVASRPVLPHELESLRLMLTKREMTLWAVVSTSPTTQNTARAMNLETSLVARSEQLEAPEVNPEEAGAPALLINRTVRGGRTVRSQGHVIVCGDVNPGAEIVAGGNIIVWGKLRGMVHAGANGDESAIVCALDLAPTQLRIASYITVSPEEKRRKPRPETALIRQGRIIAEAWNG